MTKVTIWPINHLLEKLSYTSSHELRSANQRWSNMQSILAEFELIMTKPGNSSNSNKTLA